MRILILIIFLSSCAEKPTLYGSNKTSNYARNIERTSEFELEIHWPQVLKRQPIIEGKQTPSYGQLVSIQNECNNFNWAHKDEEWSTPNEAIHKGWGDCKDSAICKYYKLRALGWKPEQLNLWSGWYGSKYLGHLTLAVRLGDKQYVLDDMYAYPIPAEEYMHKVFEPYSRFNEIGWDY